MRNQDGTYICNHHGCNCRVADDENSVRTPNGKLYCSEKCRDGVGCDCGGCDCRAKSDSH